jgi:hypothetical protein
MIDLSFLAHLIFRRRAQLLTLFLVITLLFAQPLFVSAKPVTRHLNQLAQLAQATASPQEEATTEPTEESTAEATAEDVDTAEATAIPEEPTNEPPAIDQPNINLPGSSEVAGSDTITVEIPQDSAPAANSTGDNTYNLPLTWQGEGTIAAQDLAQVAPPLQAEVSQGNFQITFVPTGNSPDAGNLLRILPVPPKGGLSSVRVGVKLDQKSTKPPLPAGENVVLQLSARLYAPDASTRVVIADDHGSSSVVLQGLNWSDYQLARAIAADVTSVEIMVEWRNVPANGWLEIRGLQVSLPPSLESAALSPTDTPALIQAIEITPTLPPPQTPTPTALDLATATPLPTATPVPDQVEAQAAASVSISESAILTPTPTLIVVTSTPTPVDIYEEATRVAQATDWARILGPATPTPPNMATETPTITPIVVTNTPAPENEATATDIALRATAVAFTTGTPTPLPAGATIVVATPTVPKPTPAPRPTNTATPIFVLLDDIPVAQPTAIPPVPEILLGKILFLTDYRGNPRAPNAMVMNPDGTGVGLLTTNYFYNIVANRDAYSADSRFYVYSLREAGGAAHNAGLIQLFYDDAFYNSPQHQLTYFGAGVAWSPAWSPTSETIAYVSSETGNDEIWISQRNQWPATQLTKNDWEWDHHPSFSPDGSQLVFSSNRISGNRQIWMMSSSGEDQRQITNFPFEAWDPVWVKYVEGQ